MRWTAPKTRSGSLVVGTYLQRGSALPPSAPPPSPEPWMSEDEDQMWPRHKDQELLFYRGSDGLWQIY